MDQSIMRVALEGHWKAPDKSDFADRFARAPSRVHLVAREES